MARRPPLKACVDHEQSSLGYLAFFEDAEIRTQRGERQQKCRECGLWQWPRLPVPGEVASGRGAAPSPSS